MKFTEFVKEMQKHFTEMTKDAKVLFTVNVDPEMFYNLYLDSFPDGTNEIYRKRREHDCSCCRHFIRDLGNVVTIKDGKVDTIWNLNINDGIYSVVAKVMDLYIKKCYVNGVYVGDEAVIGTKKSREMLPTGEIHTYDHFFMNISKKFIYTGSETKDTVKGNSQGMMFNGKHYDEYFIIHADQFPENKTDFTICLTIFRAVQRLQNFGMVSNATMMICDYDNPDGDKYEYDLSENENFENLNAVEMGRLYKYGDGFKFQALGSGYTGGMTELFKNFGLDIDEGRD